MGRQQILIEERRALRAWVRSQYPRPSQKACIEWFDSQFHRRITQSTVSESLSSRFDSLDNTTATFRARARTGQWPDLEKVLYLWQQQIEERGGITSGELLRQKALQIWQQLPQYSDRPPPEFSIGWVGNFKKRHNIKEFVQHGEAGSAPEATEVEMRSLRTLAGEYQEEDIYNMDETGLFWRMTPSRGLATTSRPGLKKDKTRVSIVVCRNATGTD